jgi:hypothetical protein
MPVSDKWKRQLTSERNRKKKLLIEVKNQLKQISTQQIHLHEATGVLQLMREQAQKASIERANLLKKKTHVGATWLR